jgi:molybdate transport system substrate-binding protein
VTDATSQPAVQVLSTLALRGVIEEIAADFAARTGLGIAATYKSTNAALELIAQGTAADMTILTREAIEALVRDGAIVAGSAAGIAQSGIGVAVRAGAPKPSIATVAAFRQAMLAAKSIAFSRVGASGIHFAEVIERLGIAAEVRRNAKVGDSYAGELAARGEAELAVQQLSELVPVQGIDIVGPFPAELQKITVFCAGIFRAAANPDGARQFIAYLAAPDIAALLIRKGLEPAGAATQ